MKNNLYRTFTLPIIHQSCPLEELQVTRLDLQKFGNNSKVIIKYTTSHLGDTKI